MTDLLRGHAVRQGLLLDARFNRALKSGDRSQSAEGLAPSSPPTQPSVTVDEVADVIEEVLYALADDSKWASWFVLFALHLPHASCSVRRIA